VTGEAELGRAIAACDFAVVVWRPPGTVCMVNQAFERLSGQDRDQLVGARVTDLFAPPQAVGAAVDALCSGAVDGLRARRQVLAGDGRQVRVLIWVRRFELEDGMLGVGLVVPAPEVSRLGRNPSAVWRDVAAVAIGTSDPSLRVEQVSVDIRDILGYDPAEMIGRSLLEFLHPDDVAADDVPADDVPADDVAADDVADDAREAEGAHLRVALRCPVRMRRADGSWAQVGLLTAPCPEGTARIAFAILGSPDPAAASATGRVAELELRLRRIGAEVRAAGLIDKVAGLPAPSDHAQLAELTSRQWEILSRLLRGQRVGSIAAALYLSPSTVRNHLSAIFRRFAVHSQSELIALLRP